MSRSTILGLTALLALVIVVFNLAADDPEEDRWIDQFKVGQEIQANHVSHSGMFSLSTFPATQHPGNVYFQSQFIEKIGADYLLIRREQGEIKDGKRILTYRTKQCIPFAAISEVNLPGENLRKGK